jgi:manganese/zinc/iron transport system permease protein
MIEKGAAMGVVFTAMFAAGVLLLEQSDTSHVHLDVEHALFGNLETLIWLQSDGWASLLRFEDLAQLPPQFFRMLIALLIISAFTYVFWRPLVLISFDEAYSRTIGVQATLIGCLLVVLAAMAAVAAFEAVGSIIVIAMILCPPATARLLTNNIRTQVILSLFLALSATLVGYITAGYVPLWLGFSITLSAAGMIATVSGLLLALSAIYGRHRKRIT